MPMSWPRWTFLTSPEKEVDATANQIENAGQIMNLRVSPKWNGTAAPCAPCAAIFSYAPVPSRSLKCVLKSRPPAAATISTRMVTARRSEERRVGKGVDLGGGKIV